MTSPCKKCYTALYIQPRVCSEPLLLSETNGMQQNLDSKLQENDSEDHFINTMKKMLWKKIIPNEQNTPFLRTYQMLRFMNYFPNTC